MVASGMPGSVRLRRARRGAGAQAFLARLDRLVDLVAERRAIEALERPLRARLAADMLAHAKRGGLDQFRRPGGLVTLVEPQPCWECFNPQAFAGWLAANGYGHLVREQVAVIDHGCLIGLLRRPGPVHVSRLASCVAVVAEPDPDAPEQLDVEVREDGTLLTRDGQVVPGVRRVVREPWVQVWAGTPVARASAE